MRCYAILMAAGLSNRFGSENKLLVPFNGKPLFCHTLDLVCGMDCFEKIIMVYNDEKVAALINSETRYKNHEIITVFNPAPEKGQGESARLGVIAVDVKLTGNEPVYYLFFPCDQPLLDTATIQLLLNNAKPGFITETGNIKPGSPNLFSSFFHDELLALKQGENPRLIKKRHPELVITVEVPNSIILSDIDTPEDLERLNEDSSCR